MNQSRKVLVLGATGAMGQYLVPRLAAMGYRVDGVSIDDKADNIPNVNYIKANAKDRAVLQQLLANSYDGIVDFMIYNSGELPYFLPLLPEHTDHYIYLSSYRVYDNKEHPVRETSPRLIDSSDDLLLRNSDDYSIYNAQWISETNTNQNRWFMLLQRSGYFKQMTAYYNAGREKLLTCASLSRSTAENVPYGLNKTIHTSSRKISACRHPSRGILIGESSCYFSESTTPPDRLTWGRQPADSFCRGNSITAESTSFSSAGTPAGDGAAKCAITPEAHPITGKKSGTRIMSGDHGIPSFNKE